MNKGLFIFLLMFFGLCFSQTEKDLYGKWIEVNATDKNGSFTFFPEGFILLEAKDRVLDGRKYIIPSGSNKGKTAHIRYDVDFSQKPHKVKLIMSYIDGEDEIQMGKMGEGYLEFLKEDVIMFFLDFDNEKPGKLDPLSKNTALLKREKKL